VAFARLVKFGVVASTTPDIVSDEPRPIRQATDQAEVGAGNA
jgi:hypothetical protein